MNRNLSLEIIELGSGDCSKNSILIDAVRKVNLENVNYIPVDISKSAIENSADELLENGVDKYFTKFIEGFVR